MKKNTLDTNQSYHLQIKNHLGEPFKREMYALDMYQNKRIEMQQTLDRQQNKIYFIYRDMQKHVPILRKRTKKP